MSSSQDNNSPPSMNANDQPPQSTPITPLANYSTPISSYSSRSQMSPSDSNKDNLPVPQSSSFVPQLTYDSGNDKSAAQQSDYDEPSGDDNGHLPTVAPLSLPGDTSAPDGNELMNELPFASAGYGANDPAPHDTLGLPTSSPPVFDFEQFYFEQATNTSLNAETPPAIGTSTTQTSGVVADNINDNSASDIEDDDDNQEDVEDDDLFFDSDTSEIEEKKEEIRFRRLKDDVRSKYPNLGIRVGDDRDMVKSMEEADALAEKLTATDEKYPDLKINAKDMARADVIAELLRRIPANHVAQETSANKLHCGIWTAATLLANITHKFDCTFQHKAGIRRVYDQLCKYLLDGEHTDRRRQIIASMSGRNVSEVQADAENDVELDETEFIGYPTMATLVRMYCEDYSSEFLQLQAGFTLLIVPFDRRNGKVKGRVINAFEGYVYGDGGNHLTARCVDEMHWEPVGPLLDPSDESLYGAAKDITAYDRRMDPRYNHSGQVPTEHICGQGNCNDIRHLGGVFSRLQAGSADEMDLGTLIEAAFAHPDTRNAETRANQSISEDVLMADVSDVAKRSELPVPAGQHLLRAVGDGRDVDRAARWHWENGVEANEATKFFYGRFELNLLPEELIERILRPLCGSASLVPCLATKADATPRKKTKPALMSAEQRRYLGLSDRIRVMVNRFFFGDNVFLCHNFSAVQFIWSKMTQTQRSALRYVVLGETVATDAPSARNCQLQLAKLMRELPEVCGMVQVKRDGKMFLSRRPVDAFRTGGARVPELPLPDLDLAD